MKFWHKAFLATLALFLIAFDFGIFMIADLSYQNSMDSETMKDLGEQYFIAASLAKDMEAIEAREGDTGAMLKSLFEYYGVYYGKQDVSLEVIRDGKSVYSTLPPYDGERVELVLPEGIRNTLVRETETGQYLYITGALPAPYQNDTLVYAKNLDFITDTQDDLTQALLTASIMISATLATALYFVLRRLSRPIRALSKTTGRIAAGEYGERVHTRGKDEFARLGESFNDMADEIEFQMQSLARASRQKQQFIDNLAHELRTPLTTIHGYAEYIQKAVITEEDRVTATQYIMDESNRLKEVAFKLMDMAVMRENGIDAQKLSMKELVERSVETANINAARKQIEIRTDADELTVWGDADLLQSLLINLIDNGVKACNPGGEVCINVFRDADGNAVTEVKDNGRGMTKEQLEHIAQPFYRVDKARSRQEGGAGLGLALCRQIVECHNADITFLSEAGKGTTVTLTFYTSITRRLELEYEDEAKREGEKRE